MDPSFLTSIAIMLGEATAWNENVLQAYSGALIMYSPRRSALNLTDWTRYLVEKAFHPLDPQLAQHELSVDQFVDIVAPLKPAFIDHPETKRLMKAYLEDIGVDPMRTYLDVPRMRVVTSGGYLQSGVGHKQPPHRDTWWSSPLQQIQFWSPIFPMERGSSMEFYPYYANTAVPNSSRNFDLYRWNATGRRNAAQHRNGKDQRGIPETLEPIEQVGACQIVLPVGGMVMFSGNQLHATVENRTGRTRFSLDFRLVDVEHVRDGVGAINRDCECTGTALRDFQRMTDDAAMPADLVALYDNGDAGDGVLVYKPAEAMT